MEYSIKELMKEYPVITYIILGSLFLGWGALSDKINYYKKNGYTPQRL